MGFTQDGDSSIDSEDSDGNEWNFVGALRDQAPDPDAAYAEREVFDAFQRRLQALRSLPFVTRSMQATGKRVRELPLSRDKLVA